MWSGAELPRRRVSRPETSLSRQKNPNTVSQSVTVQPRAHPGRTPPHGPVSGTRDAGRVINSYGCSFRVLQKFKCGVHLPAGNLPHNVALFMLRCWSVQCFRCRRRASPTPAAAAVWPVCYADVAAKPETPWRNAGRNLTRAATASRDPGPRRDVANSRYDSLPDSLTVVTIAISDFRPMLPCTCMWSGPQARVGRKLGP